MNPKKVMWLTVVTISSLLFLALLANLSLAQEAGKGAAAAGAQQEALKTTIEGKIVYMKSYGGYIVISETPHEEYKIINENAKVLGELAKQGKTVTIEGNFPRGAYLLFIEKINGKKYQGKQ